MSKLWSQLTSVVQQMSTPGRLFNSCASCEYVWCPEADMGCVTVERRGYAKGPIAWQSHRKQKFACTTCKRTFPRMEVLLQHFRDSSKHRYATPAGCKHSSCVSRTCLASCSREPISRESSIQMSNWLLAKDQQQHCCPTCCLGFKTDTELFVHLKHTEVHKVELLPGHTVYSDHYRAEFCAQRWLLPIMIASTHTAW